MESTNSATDVRVLHRGIRRALDKFFERVGNDPVLADSFADLDADRVERHQVLLLAAAAGDLPSTASAMLKAHNGLQITNHAYDRVLGHLNAAMVDAGTDDGTIRRVISVLSRMRVEIVQD